MRIALFNFRRMIGAQTSGAAGLRSALVSRFAPASRSPGGRVGFLLAIMLMLVPCLAGCQSFGTSKKVGERAEARTRWDSVRGAIKAKQARQQLDGGLFDEALRSATEAVSLDPRRPEGYVVLARAHQEQGRTASAWQAIESARAADVASVDLLYTEGVILEQRGEAEAALQRFERAAMLDPRRVDVIVARAELLVMLGRVEDALRLLDEQAGQLDDNGSVFLLGGHVSLMLGDEAGAVERYRKAVVSLRTSRMAAYELGLLLARGGTCEEAVPLLSPLLNSLEMDVARLGNVRRALAGCHLARGDAAHAQGVLLGYATDATSDGAAQLLLAKAALANGDLLTAMSALERAERVNPLHREVWLVRAVVQWRRGRLDEAAQTLRDILVSHPDDVEAHCLLGEVLRDRDQGAAARHHFESALALNPGCRWAASGLEALDRPGLSAPRRGDDRVPRLTAAEGAEPARGSDVRP